MAPYRYTKLPEEGHWIRLMTILPNADFRASIACYLTDVRLPRRANPPIYDAISYVWGSREDPVALEIGPSGGSIETTRNLAELLPYIRRPDRQQTLWIDAICVNQQDMDERSKQVRRMAEIFGRADRVVAWLGVESGRSSMGMAKLRDLADHVDVDWDGDFAMKAHSDHASEAHWADRSRPLPFNGTVWASVVDVLERPWFTRLWIVQEVQLANNRAEFLCGHDNILREQLKRAVRCIRSKAAPESPSPELDATIRNARRLGTIALDIMLYRPKTPLVKTIYRVRNPRCHGDRDRIYAIQGLMSAKNPDLVIEPDYTLSSALVYTEFVREFVQKRQCLALLALCGSGERPAALPSWVPNFAFANTSRPLSKVRASGLSSCVVEFCEPSLLRAAGLRVGVVKMSERLGHVDNLRDEGVLLSHFGSVAKRHPMATPYSPGVSYTEAYARTLCAGRTQDRRLPLDKGLPDVVSAQALLLTALQSSSSDAVDTSRDTAREEVFLKYWRTVCTGRSFFETTENHIGIGPQHVEPGDQLCVLLGSDAPVLLRPLSNGQHVLVGQCYVPDLMCAEALLGPLPHGVSIVIKKHAASELFTEVFVDTDSGEAKIEDPRLGPLPPGWVRYSHADEHLYALFTHEDSAVRTSFPLHRDYTEFDPRLSRSALAERGVELPDFELV